MKSDIYLLDKKIRKMTKKIREKQKFRYSNNVMTNMASLWHQTIILELNKYNPTLPFHIWI